jgi:hypothetical protein
VLDHLEKHSDSQGRLTYQEAESQSLHLSELYPRKTPITSNWIIIFIIIKYSLRYWIYYFLLITKKANIISWDCYINCRKITARIAAGNAIRWEKEPNLDKGDISVHQSVKNSWTTTKEYLHSLTITLVFYSLRKQQQNQLQNIF